MIRRRRMSQPDDRRGDASRPMPEREGTGEGYNAADERRMLLASLAWGAALVLVLVFVGCSLSLYLALQGP
jgi:hypothetical protein